MRAMLLLGSGAADGSADVPFGRWLDEHRQPPGLVATFYDPVLVGALNEDTRSASAAYAIQVFQDSLLANARGYVRRHPELPAGRVVRARCRAATCGRACERRDSPSRPDRVHGRGAGIGRGAGGRRGRPRDDHHGSRGGFRRDLAEARRAVPGLASGSRACRSSACTCGSTGRCCKNPTPHCRAGRCSGCSARTRRVVRSTA